ncbi:unnamed protein product, partial [Arabidopsis halleri]
EEYNKPHVKVNRCISVLERTKNVHRPTEGDWTTMERRFDKMTANTSGLLTCSKYGECIGINSKEIALELFDALARRR